MRFKVTYTGGEFATVEATGFHGALRTVEAQQRRTGVYRAISAIELRGTFEVKCDECKREIGRTDSARESAAGGRCEACSEKTVDAYEAQEEERIGGAAPSKAARPYHERIAAAGRGARQTGRG